MTAAPLRIRWAVVTALAALAVVSAGCGPGADRKPQLYRLTGRIIDGETRQGVPSVRLLLRAVIPTSLGKRTLAAYGVTDADGKYDVELSEGFAVLHYADSILLEAAKPGYLPSRIDVPPPGDPKSAHTLPDLTLERGQLPSPANPAVPGLTRPPAPMPRRNPLPWHTHECYLCRTQCPRPYARGSAAVRFAYSSGVMANFRSTCWR